MDGSSGHGVCLERQATFIIIFLAMHIGKIVGMGKIDGGVVDVETACGMIE